MMSFDISEHLPEDFAASSRVWIYQCNRIFFMSELLDIETMLQEFVTNWKSHGTPVKGYANIFFGRFVVLMADENATGVSGCSTDSSVRLIKAIESKYNVNMFDRLLLAFYIKDKVEQIPLSQLNYAITNNFITPDTLYFDNTILTKKDLMERWPSPVKQTWLANKFV
ncbi:hypothetical protein ACFOWM_03735 [Ferruginibacter yonginensis]|uniref:ABC transporter ATPase n=1 Tax=Ferruginibacter yonginensis TaxID=1310416 RepID=A0ABV8QP52_9BACT